MVHLVIVQHGLWGNPGNTAYLQELLSKQLGENYYVLNSNVNSGSLTYDGIDVCGDRLHALVMQTHQALAGGGQHVRAISLIGYSMGGLITRYLAGRLYAEGYFGGVTPVNFITIATPHLGAWKLPTSWYNRTFNFMVPVVTSRSGHQLVLQDKHTWGKPLMCIMSHPELVFMQALRQFKQLMLLANIFHDRPVPYCTASIRLDNPYEKHPPVPVDPKYPSIVRISSGAPLKCALKSAVQGAAEAIVTAATAGHDEGGAARTYTAASPLYAGPIGELVEPAEPPSAAADTITRHSAPNPQQLQQHTLRPLRSTYLPLFMLVCFPLFIPALAYMVISGRSHYAHMMRQRLDFSWITDYHRHDSQHKSSGSEGAERRSGSGSGEGAAKPVQASMNKGLMGRLRSAASARKQRASGAGDAAEQAEAMPADIECPSAPDMYATGADAAESGATLGLAASPSLDEDGQDAVVLAEFSAGDGGASGPLLMHDGIVELPAGVHRAQEWLVEQLNGLPWIKVDVDCRDLHAHAAIIMRNPGRFTANRDVLDFVLDRFVRA